MENKGQVQTNENKVNVLVDTVNSSNRHSHWSNRGIKDIKALSDSEIIDLWKNREKENELELARAWIKKQDGYAISNCKDDTLGINYSSIVSYKE